jgi:uncharacterized protein
MTLFKAILVLLGTISLGIGLIAIVVPGLPTTPFLLLTAGLYAKSSDKLYQKVITNRYIGRYITEYQTNKSIPLKTKLYSIGLMWAMIFVSVSIFITQWQMQVLLAVAGILGTIVIGFVIKTRMNN